MEGYILTAGGYVLTRVILCAFAIFHCFVGYGNALLRFYVPPKLYHGFFITETVVLTAFIAWCCVCEPFGYGVAWSVIGYFLVYLVLFCCWYLCAHVMISHTKVYDMVPCYRISKRNSKGISGYIRAGGINHTVAVLNKELYERVEDKTPLKVRFKCYPKRTKSFRAVMKVINE